MICYLSKSVFDSMGMNRLNMNCNAQHVILLNDKSLCVYFFNFFLPESRVDHAYFHLQMIFPWMFDEIHALKPFKDVANKLAEKKDWPRLYDSKVLNNNKVCCFYSSILCRNVIVCWHLKPVKSFSLKSNSNYILCRNVCIIFFIACECYSVKFLSLKIWIDGGGRCLLQLLYIMKTYM